MKMKPVGGAYGLLPRIRDYLRFRFDVIVSRTVVLGRRLASRLGTKRPVRASRTLVFRLFMGSPPFRFCRRGDRARLNYRARPRLDMYLNYYFSLILLLSSYYRSD